MPQVTIGAALSDLRAELTRTRLAPSDRERIIEQAEVILNGLYVHLDQKRSLYGVDAITRLRQLARRAAALPDAEFHAAVTSIFHDLHDGHTYYALPMPYQKAYFSLGFLVERCWVNGDEIWLVSHVRSELAGADLQPGAEITHWNGTAIAVAVARHAANEWGSNPAARLARGLDNLTQRWVGQSAVPDEDWVDLRFLLGGVVHETRIPWRLVSATEMIDDDRSDVSAGAGNMQAHAEDRQTLVLQHMKFVQFAASDPDPQDPQDPAAREIHTALPNIRAKVVTTPSGTFGHLRIYSFTSRVDATTFLDAIAEVLPQLPPSGLILDVRGNGGGLLASAEGLLQMFTPRRIEPETFQFRITEQTAMLVRATADVGTFAPWAGSVDESLAIGAQYSTALPHDEPDSINDRGQLYHGPVVLITDALCYSATDIFAAGFQDHDVGLVLGVDNATGAGGASVYKTATLELQWPGSPLDRLPHGAELGTALLRALRVRRNAGRALEDIGVTPDIVYRITAEDLLDHNIELLARAGELLAGRPVVRLEAVVEVAAGAERLRLRTEGLTSIDIYLNGRPVTTSAVADGETVVELADRDLAKAAIRVDGYRDAKLIAARTLVPGRGT